MAINLEFVILLLNEFPGTMEVERKVGNAGNFVLALIIVVILGTEILAIIEREIGGSTLMGVTGAALKADRGKRAVIERIIFIDRGVVPNGPLQQIVVFIIEGVNLVVEMKLGRLSHGRELYSRCVERIDGEFATLEIIAIGIGQIGVGLGIGQLQAELIVRHIQ